MRKKCRQRTNEELVSSWKSKCEGHLRIYRSDTGWFRCTITNFRGYGVDGDGKTVGEAFGFAFDQWKNMMCDVYYD